MRSTLKLQNIQQMKQCYIYAAILLSALLAGSAGYAQQSIGIGTNTPDANAALDITSTQKGVLIPTLNTAQQNTLAGMLTGAEIGMLVTDAATGSLRYWNGSSWQVQTTANALTAMAPLSVTSNTVSLNPGTLTGDLITWDGVNWVNTQPAVQHFDFVLDNHQPYLVINYCIAMFGIFPTQNDATEPYVGEIYAMGCNFAPVGFAMCNGALLSIAANTVLFDLIGTTYGGDGQTTFALPDLRGRVAIHQGNNGTSTYAIGQTGGFENKTFSQ
jgi:microcystin-dependent protein